MHHRSHFEVSQQSVNTGVHGRADFWQIPTTLHQYAQALIRYLYVISNSNTLRNQMPLFSSENHSYIDNLGLRVLPLPSCAAPPPLPGPAITFCTEKCARGEGVGMPLYRAHPVGVRGALRADGAPCTGPGVENLVSQTQALQH